MAISTQRISKTPLLSNTEFRDRVRLVLRKGQSVPPVVRYSLLLFTFSIPFEAADLPFTSGTLSIARISGLLLAATYFFYYSVVKKRVSPWLPPAMCWLLGYFLIRSLSVFRVADDDFRAFLTFSFSRFQMLVLFWVAVELLRDAKLSIITFRIFVLASILLSIGTIFGVFGTPVEVGSKLRTFEQNSNTLGGVTAVAFVATLGLVMFGTSKKFIPNALLLASLLPLTKIIVSTGSRSAIGTVLIGCLVYSLSFARSRRKFILIAVLMLGFITSMYLAASDPVQVERWQQAFYEYRFSNRQEIYGASIEMFLEKPVFGWGAQTHSNELGWRLGQWAATDQHNILLYLLCEVGLVGAAPFLIGVWLIVLNAWKGRSGTLGYIPLAILAAVGANCMVENGLDFRSKLFWFVLALAFAASPGTASASSLGTMRRENNPVVRTKN